MNTNIKVGDCFGLGWSIFKEHMGDAIGAAFLMMVLGLLSCGILLPALLCGFLLLADGWSKKHGPSLNAGEIFTGLRYFLQSMGCVLLLLFVRSALTYILHFIPFFGRFASFMVDFLAYSIGIWVLLVVVHQKISCFKAVYLVLNETFHNRFGMPIIVGCLANMLMYGVAFLIHGVAIVLVKTGGDLGRITFVLWVIGVFAACAPSLCVYAAAYRKFFDAPEVEVVA